jgi:hypothetical protein
MNLPNNISGFTVFDLLGDYKIVLNAKLDYEKQIEAYRHEIICIQNRGRS